MDITIAVTYGGKPDDEKLRIKWGNLLNLLDTLEIGGEWVSFPLPNIKTARVCQTQCHTYGKRHKNGFNAQTRIYKNEDGTTTFWVRRV